MNSLANPSSSPCTKLSRDTKWLYAITEGMATARPATVVISASAMPGATAEMLVDPIRVMPRNVFMMPITVPMSPSRGDTEPITASQLSPCAKSSASSALTLSITMRNASSWVSERPGVPATVSVSPSAPGLRCPTKLPPSLKTRVYGESGNVRTTTCAS